MWIFFINDSSRCCLDLMKCWPLLFQEEIKGAFNVLILSNKSRTGAGGMSVNTQYQELSYF